jgi:hypothetical protein
MMMEATCMKQSDINSKKDQDSRDSKTPQEKKMKQNVCKIKEKIKS